MTLRTRMKIGFIGCVESSQIALEALLLSGETDYQVMGVITKKSSSFNTDFVDLSHLCADHSVVSDALMSASKSFRHPSVKRVLAFETLSETEFSLRVDEEHFRPNVFVNIEKYINQKIEIMGQFKSEMGDFPFPRSAEAIQALAKYRGVQAGCKSAEAFMLLKEIR